MSPPTPPPAIVCFISTSHSTDIRIRIMDLPSSVHAWSDTGNSALETQPNTDNFVCSTCGRAYKAKESLTRHEENHTGATKYVCNRCGIGFHRRDLLSRHAQVHAMAKNKRSGDNRRTGRQRTHRACDDCRAMKIKCDSRVPCSSCVRRAHQCTYTKPPHRLSLAHQTEIIATSHDSRTTSPRTSSTTSVSDMSDLDQSGDQEMQNAELGEDGAISLQQHEGMIGSATHDASNAFTIYGAPVTGENANPHPVGSCSAFNIDQASASGNSTHDMPPLSPVLQMDFNQFRPPEGLPQPFSWPWLFEESYLQQPPALTNVAVLSEFSENCMVDYTQADFQSYPLNPPVPSIASLTALTNSTASDEQYTMQDIAQSSFHYPSGGRPERTSGLRSTAQYGLAQASLDMDLTEHPIESFSVKRASNRQVSSVQDKSQNIVVLERKRQVVQKMVDATFEDSSASKSSPNAQKYRSQMWDMLCPEIEQAFFIKKDETTMMSQPHILHEYVALYFRHFNRLWPLIWQHGLNFEDIPGPLYLTLAMIGSMYAGQNAPDFGFMVHEYISRALMLAPTWRLDADDVTYSTCRSLLLTQVASLYFGTKKAFSCAQQLGSILVSLARKIGLFKRSWSSNDFEDDIAGGPTHTSNLVSRWTENESRKRLAFGIFRADTFLSLLLNTRPLLSHEEIFLSMPCPNSVWEYSARDLQAYIKMSAAEDDTRRGLPFSDLVQIAMDRAEPLPALKPGEYELLVFALQQSVWRFSHDPDILRRLTGTTPCATHSRPASQNHDVFDGLYENHDFGLSITDSMPKSSSRAHSADLDDALDWSRRRMADLHSDYERALCALKKWKQSFAAGSTSAQSGHDRDLLLSSRLLYHLSFVRLNAEVEAFHLLACQPAAYRRQQCETLCRVYQWSRSPAAQVAVEHAYTIWTVVQKEIRRTEDCRARFNIIAFISLHHAASVIWAYAGTRDSCSVGKGSGSKGGRSGSTKSSSAARREQPEGIQSLDDVELCRDNTHPLLTRFAALLRNVSPAWVAVSAFSTTAAVMADNPLPLFDY